MVLGSRKIELIALVENKIKMKLFQKTINNELPISQPLGTDGQVFTIRIGSAEKHPINSL